MATGGLISQASRADGRTCHKLSDERSELFCLSAHQESSCEVPEDTKLTDVWLAATWLQRLHVSKSLLGPLKFVNLFFLGTTGAATKKQKIEQ